MTKRTTQKYSYSAIDSYSNYEGEVDKNTYIKILEVYCDLLFDKLLSGYQIRLPKSLGYISFFKKKSNMINWAKTNRHHGEYNAGLAKYEERKRILERNDHTDGFVVYPKWINKSHAIPRKSFFKFTLSRQRKKQLANHLKTTSLIGNYNTE